MPYMMTADFDDVVNHYQNGQVFEGAPKLEEVIEMAINGKVEVECSSFSDPGEDYTALTIDGRRITYWPGY